MGLNLNIKELVENKNIEVEPKKEKPVTRTVNMISLIDFIKKNKEKVMLTMVDISKDEVNSLLFRNNKNKLLLFEDCNELCFHDHIVDTITIATSGFIIIGPLYKTYVSRSNIIQFNVKDNVPTIFTKFGKRSKVTETENSSYKYSTIEEIMLLIRSASPPLYESIKENTNKKLILEKVIEFESKIKDINYAVKINRKILMNANFSD